MHAPLGSVTSRPSYRLACSRKNRHSSATGSIQRVMVLEKGLASMDPANTEGTAVLFDLDYGLAAPLIVDRLRSNAHAVGDSVRAAQWRSVYSAILAMNAGRMASATAPVSLAGKPRVARASRAGSCRTASETCNASAARGFSRPRRADPPAHVRHHAVQGGTTSVGPPPSWSRHALAYGGRLPGPGQRAAPDIGCAPRPLDQSGTHDARRSLSREGQACQAGRGHRVACRGQGGGGLLARQHLVRSGAALGFATCALSTSSTP